MSQSMMFYHVLCFIVCQDPPDTLTLMIFLDINTFDEAGKVAQGCWKSLLLDDWKAVLNPPKLNLSHKQNQKTDYWLPSLKLTFSPLKMDKLEYDRFLLGFSLFSGATLVSGRLNPTPFAWGLDKPWPTGAMPKAVNILRVTHLSSVSDVWKSPDQKNSENFRWLISSPIWVFPKIGVPPNHPFL